MTVIRSRADGRGAVSFLARYSTTLCILLLSPFAYATQTEDCHVGSYRFSNGGIVDIAPSEGATLRWRRFDGTTGALTKKRDDLWISTLGWTGRPDGKTVHLSACAAGRITFDGMEGLRLTFAVTDDVR